MRKQQIPYIKIDGEIYDAINVTTADDGTLLGIAKERKNE